MKTKSIVFTVVFIILILVISFSPYYISPWYSDLKNLLLLILLIHSTVIIFCFIYFFKSLKQLKASGLRYEFKKIEENNKKLFVSTEKTILEIERIQGIINIIKNLQNPPKDDTNTSHVISDPNETPMKILTDDQIKVLFNKLVEKI
jgi:hypothetical protein